MRFHQIILACLLFVLFGCSTDDPTRYNTFIPLTSIEVTGTYQSMANQTVNQYRAIGDFSGAFTRDITTEVSWSIENENIASVSNDTGSQGLVTALAPGDTSVVAMYGDILGSAPVVVKDSSLAAIEIIPQDAELQLNTAQQYQAVGTFSGILPSDETIQDITTLVTWETSDPTVAAIDTTGRLTTLASSINPITITATWQGIPPFSASTSLAVTEVVLTSIIIEPVNDTIAQDTTIQFQARGTYSDNTTPFITDKVDWQSSDPDTIASINAGGLATGNAPGTVTITASFDANGTIITDSTELTVTDATISSITVTPADSTLAVNTSQQFTAEGTFSDSSTQDITEISAWTATPNTVGTISNTNGERGLFTGNNNTGDTVIKATFDGVIGNTYLTVQ